MFRLTHQIISNTYTNKYDSTNNSINYFLLGNLIFLTNNFKLTRLSNEELIESNSPGLFNKNFSKLRTISQLQSSTNLKKTTNGFKQSSNCPANQLTFLAAFRDAPFAWGSLGFVFLPLGLFSALLLFIRLIVSNTLRNDLSIFVGYFVYHTQGIRNDRFIAVRATCRTQLPESELQVFHLHSQFMCCSYLSSFSPRMKKN